MKIAILRKKYTFHGGSEGFSQSLIKNLTLRGHEVHIFAIKWQCDNRMENLHFHRIPAINFNSFIRDLSFALLSYLIIKNRRTEFDIIQSHDKTLFQDIYRAGDGCHREWLKQRLKRSGLVLKLLTLLNPYHWLILSLERLIFNGHRYKKIIAISELVKRNILEHYEVDEKDIVVIYNGVDLDRFHPRNRALFGKELRARYGIGDDEFVVLFVGSGFERKGLRYLIEALEMIPRELTLLVVGKGNGASLKRYVKKQRVIFCGPQKDIHKYYAAADIFVFPTIYEPFGNVHLEALASGLPVITTKLSGAAEIIENGVQGFVVEQPEAVKKIAERIEYLMDKEIREDMGRAARNRAKEFSFENHIRKMTELYESITTG